MWSRISQGKSSPTQFSNIFKSCYDHMWDGKGQFTIKALCSWLLPHLRTGMRDNQSINQSITEHIINRNPISDSGVTHFHTRQVEWKSSPDSISSVLNEVQPALIISSSTSRSYRPSAAAPAFLERTGLAVSAGASNSDTQN